MPSQMIRRREFSHPINGTWRDVLEAALAFANTVEVVSVSEYTPAPHELTIAVYYRDTRREGRRTGFLQAWQPE